MLPHIPNLPIVYEFVMNKHCSPMFCVVSVIISFLNQYFLVDVLLNFSYQQILGQEVSKLVKQPNKVKHLKEIDHQYLQKHSK